MKLKNLKILSVAALVLLYVPINVSLPVTLTTEWFQVTFNLFMLPLDASAVLLVYILFSLFSKINETEKGEQ